MFLFDLIENEIDGEVAEDILSYLDKKMIVQAAESNIEPVGSFSSQSSESSDHNSSFSSC